MFSILLYRLFYIYNSYQAQYVLQDTYCDNWKKKCLDMSNKIWGGVEDDFMVLDINNLTLKEKILHLNDDILNMLYVFDYAI